MPVSMAGSRGGAIGLARESTWSRFVTRLLSGDVAYPEFTSELMGATTPSTVSLVVNNACNLRCKHCYLQVDKLSSPVLDKDEWYRLIDSIARVDPELVCLSGKEVFLSQSGADILTHMNRVKERAGASFRTGVITNGTLISRYRDSIVAAKPSYFDISLDGLEADHDAVRGSGAFARAWPNLEWAAAAFGEEFFVNLTLQQRNHENVIECIQHLNDHGVRNVELGFYVPLDYTSKDLALSSVDVAAIMERLTELASLAPRGPLKVHMDLDLTTFEPLTAFLRSDWFSLADLKEDGKGELFVEHVFPNGVVLETRLAPFPVGIRKSIRITAEGDYLAAEDTIDTGQYARRALGNARDFDFDFAALHEHARRSDRLPELLRTFYEATLPELQAAVRTEPAVASPKSHRGSRAAA